MKYRDRRRILILGLTTIMLLVVAMGISSLGSGPQSGDAKVSSNTDTAREYNIVRIPKLERNVKTLLIMSFVDWQTRNGARDLLGSAAMLIVANERQDKVYNFRKAIPEDYGLVLHQSSEPISNFNPSVVTREYLEIMKVIGTEKPLFIGFTASYTTAYLLKASELLRTDNTVLATTCKAVSKSGVIISHGVSPFIMSGDTTVLQRNFAGYVEETSTSGRESTTDVFVASECILFRATDIATVTGYEETSQSLSRHLIDMQLQLKTAGRDHSYRITALPNKVIIDDSSGLENLSFDSEHFNNDLLHFIHLQRETWLQGAVQQKASLLGVSLDWDVWCDCTGFNIEAIAFLSVLDKLVLQTRAVAEENCFCRGYPESVQNRLKQLTHPKQFDSVLRDFIPTEEHVSIWVSHKPMEHYPTFPYSGVITVTNRPDYVVGRSMLEVDKLPSSWLSILSNEDSKSVDEVWVPSTFMKNIIEQDTPNLKVPIYVVPECVDILLFDPSAVSPMDLSLSNNKFVFLSNFKWELRKGWKTLLKGYFEEFSKEDDVVLVLKTYLYMDRDPRNKKRILHKVEEFAKREGYDLTNLPEIIIIPEEIEMVMMPKLYKAANCLLMPTKGEGWGLPIHEAMAMGLPVIATNWSGITEFATDSTSLLIPINGTEPVSGSGFPQGSNWAVPSLPDFKRLMRWVFSNRDEASRLGARAREHIVANYSQEAVAPIIARRLVDIKRLVLERNLE